MYTVNLNLNCEECASPSVKRTAMSFPSLRISNPAHRPVKAPDGKTICRFGKIDPSAFIGWCNRQIGWEILPGLTKTLPKLQIVPQWILWTPPRFLWIYAYLASCLLQRKTWWFCIFGIQVSIFCLPNWSICLLRLIFQLYKSFNWNISLL